MVYHVCKDCGVGYADPRLSENEIADLYTRTYRVDGVNAKHLATKHADSIERIEFLRSTYRGPVGKVLEIGSSEGTLLQLLRDHEGWEVRGCEPYVPYGRFGIEQWNIKTDLRFFESRNFRNQEFDLVILIHVLEHIPNPIAFLRDVIKVIKPGGRILIETPDLMNPYPGRIAHSMFPAPHLMIYSNQSLRRLLGRIGFCEFRFQNGLNIRLIATLGRSEEALVPLVERSYTRRLFLKYRSRQVLESAARLTDHLRRKIVEFLEIALGPRYRALRTIIKAK